MLKSTNYQRSISQFISLLKIKAQIFSTFKKNGFEIMAYGSKILKTSQSSEDIFDITYSSIRFNVITLHKFMFFLIQISALEIISLYRSLLVCDPSTKSSRSTNMYIRLVRTILNSIFLVFNLNNYIQAASNQINLE